MAAPLIWVVLAASIAFCVSVCCFIAHLSIALEETGHERLVDDDVECEACTADDWDPVPASAYRNPDLKTFDTAGAHSHRAREEAEFKTENDVSASQSLLYLLGAVGLSSEAVRRLGSDTGIGHLDHLLDVNLAHVPWSAYGPGARESLAEAIAATSRLQLVGAMDAWSLRVLDLRDLVPLLNGMGIAAAAGDPARPRAANLTCYPSVWEALDYVEEECADPVEDAVSADFFVEDVAAPGPGFQLEPVVRAGPLVPTAGKAFSSDDIGDGPTQIHIHLSHAASTLPPSEAKPQPPRGVVKPQPPRAVKSRPVSAPPRTRMHPPGPTTAPAAQWHSPER